MSTSDSWWRRAQARGVDVATALRRFAGFLAKGGTDPAKAAASRRHGEIEPDGEQLKRDMLARRERVAREAAATIDVDKPLEIWVITEQLWEQRWRSCSVQPVVGDRHVECYGSTREKSRGADFRYRLAHLLQSHDASLPWEEARRKATRARIYVAIEVKKK